MKVCFFLYIFTSICPPTQFESSTDGVSTFLLFAALILYLVRKHSDVSLKQNKFIFMMLCIYVLSVMQYLYLYGVMEAVKFWISKAILYYLLVNVIEKKQDFKHVIWILILSTSVLIIFGWNLYIYHPEELDIGVRIKAFGSYNLSNSFGLLLTVIWPLGFFLAEIESSTFKKALLIVFLIVSFVTLVYTKSRGSLIGFTTAVTLCIYFSRNIFSSKSAKICAMSVLCFLVFSFALHQIYSREGIDNIENLYGEGDISAENRLMAWRAAVKMAIAHPILGVGWGAFTDYSLEYGMDRRMIVHNTPLNVLAETGAFGFYAYLSFMLITLRQLFAISRSLKYPVKYEYIQRLSCGVLIGLISFNVNTMFSVKDHDTTLWILLGLGGALCGAYNKILKLAGAVYRL